MPTGHWCAKTNWVRKKKRRRRKYLKMGMSNLICAVLHDMRSSSPCSPDKQGQRNLQGSLPAPVHVPHAPTCQTVLSARLCLAPALCCCHYPASSGAALMRLVPSEYAEASSAAEGAIVEQMPDRESAERETFPSSKLTFSAEPHPSVPASSVARGPVLPSLSAPLHVCACVRLHSHTS